MNKNTGSRLSVLDSSAVLALILGEPGADRVNRIVANSLISAVNLSEIVSKLCERGNSIEVVSEMIGALYLNSEDFDEQQAYVAGSLRAATRPLGLSFGDRACLALALRENAIVVTADKAWQKLSLDFDLEMIR